MRDNAEGTSDRVRWVSGDASCAKQLAPLGLESFELVW
jgi:hypothetical protein